MVVTAGMLLLLLKLLLGCLSSFLLLVVLLVVWLPCANAPDRCARALLDRSGGDLPCLAVWVRACCTATVMMQFEY